MSVKPLNQSANFFSRFLRKKEVWILVFILAATFFSMSPCLFNGFVNLDDPFHVIGNRDIRSLDWDHLKDIFTSTATRGYIPLTFFSFAVEYHFFGLNPFVFHLDNVLMHLIVTALVFTLALRMRLGIWAAGLAGLLFGIHPMHVESVAWVTERKDVLYAVFYMLALYSYWSYLETQRKRSFVLTMIWGILSMMAKPMALSLPLIFLVLDWMKGRKITFKVFAEKFLHLLYIIPLALVTYFVHTPSYHLPSGGALLVWIWSSVFYIWKFFFPVVLSPYYVRPDVIALWNPSYLAAIIFLVLFVLVLIRFKENRWLVFAGLFYFLSVFFLFQFTVTKIDVVADRFMYLPSVGFCFLFGFLIQQGCLKLDKNKFLRLMAVTCVVGLFGILSVKTFLQCRIWKDSVTMWSAALQNHPDHTALLYQMGKAYEYMKDYDSSIVQYDKILSLDPDYGMAYANRGAIFLRLGREEAALRDFDKAVKLEPAFAPVIYNRSLIYFQRKQYESALVDLNKALELEPKFVNAYAKRGLVYADMKQYGLSIESYNQGLQINPSSSKLYYYRSLAYVNQSRFDEAFRDAVKAQALGYPNLDVYINQLKQHASSK